MRCNLTLVEILAQVLVLIAMLEIAVWLVAKYQLSPWLGIPIGVTVVAVPIFLVIRFIDRRDNRRSQDSPKRESWRDGDNEHVES